MIETRRVLIPTNEADFTLSLVQAYRSLGWEVVTGASNFDNRSAGYDVVHYQWPEEYCNWQIPTADELQNICKNVEWWSCRAKTVFSVNNLYPHNGFGNPANHQLYSCFYEHCHLITHYSNASLRLVRDEFPAARQARHVVHSPPNYAATLGRQKSRGSRRAEMRIDEEEFVILIFCRLRSIEEMDLIRHAFDLAKIPRKRLLMAGKVHFNVSRFTKYITLLPWQLWLRRTRAVVDARHVPESEVSRFLDSCNVAVVPRLYGLASGVPLIAMSFGRMVIAPNCGAYPDYFTGSRNLLYEPGNAVDLARKLEEASRLDTDEIGRENAVIAGNWSWRDICITCLGAADASLLSPNNVAITA